MSTERTGIVCMAYGSPAEEADVEAYYTHIRGGRPPSAESLAELTARYRRIGRSPLLDITRAQASALAERTGLATFVGMKHAPPFVADAVEEASQAGMTRLVGLPMAPHYARMSLGGYQRALAESWPGPLIFIPGFHAHPAFIGAVRSLLAESMAERMPERIFFTAHSLPARIVAEGDGYVDQLMETCRLVTDGLELPGWEVAFQSASHTGEPWLGPDLLEAVERSGARDVLVCPVGFVADHLEILYDLDIEAQAYARSHNIRIQRTPSFNDRPDFIDALGAIVETAIEGAGTRQC